MELLPVRALDPAGSEGQIPTIIGGVVTFAPPFVPPVPPASGGTGRTDPLGARLTKKGVVLGVGAGGAFDAAKVESLTVLRDPKSGRYIGAYTGYDASLRARAGYAYSNDLRTWTKLGVLLPHSGVAGSPDENGVTGPLLLWDNTAKVYVLYYIGLTAVGYEAGTKSLCMATATSLTGPWTRRGTVIAPGGGGWRQGAVWHPSVVERDGTWFLFFNAGDSLGIERIGYATGPSIQGPWTVDDAHSPLLTTGSGWESAFVGDPSVRRVGDVWVMDYYGVNGGFNSASDGIAVTSDADFPLGWVRYPDNPILSPSQAYDAKFAHKPFVMVDGGIVFHYYTAVAADDTRQIALATSEASPALTVQDENVTLASGVAQLDFQGAGVTATVGAGGEIVVTIPGGSGGSVSVTGGELLMQDGVTGPPVPLETEARSDWLYQG